MNRKLSVLLAAALVSVFVVWVYYQGLRKAGVNRGEFAPPVWSLGRNGEVKILHKNGEMEFCNSFEFVDFHASEAWQDCLLAFSELGIDIEFKSQGVSEKGYVKACKSAPSVVRGTDCERL